MADFDILDVPLIEEEFTEVLTEIGKALRYDLDFKAEMVWKVEIEESYCSIKFNDSLFYISMPGATYRIPLRNTKPLISILRRLILTIDKDEPDYRPFLDDVRNLLNVFTRPAPPKVY